MNQHAGECTIYRSMINGRPCDGVCTCGYGWSLVRKGDCSQMYSEERERETEALAKFQEMIKARHGGVESAFLGRRDESYKTDQYRGLDADGMARIYDSTRDDSTHAHSGKGPTKQE